METETKTIAIVTGANRGIGFEVCRQLAEKGITVIMGAREAAKGETASQDLASQGVTVVSHLLDVTDVGSVEALRAFVEHKYGKLDILINNAGINYDIWQHTVGANLDMVQETLDTNLFGAWRMVEAFLPLLKASENARIVNVSSESSSFHSPAGLARTGGELPAYSVSKVALNAYTVKLAADLKDTHILVNVVCPGWTATYPGAEAEGARPVSEGAASIVWAAVLPKGGATGGFFRDGKPLEW